MKIFQQGGRMKKFDLAFWKYVSIDDDFESMTIIFLS